MDQSLRGFLSILERNSLLSHIKRLVNPRFELAAVLNRAIMEGKAALFENVYGFTNHAVGGVASTRKMLALALGVEESCLLEEFLARSRSVVPPRVLTDGPIMRIIDDNPDASKIPIATHFERDAGPYIVAGIVVARDPETDFVNLSFNRMQVKGGRKFGIRMMPPQHLGIVHGHAEERKRNLEVAVVLGNHPCLMLAGAATLPFGEDHLNFAGSLFQEPLDVVKCRTCDLLVPAHSELVLEGEVLASVREEEGPFGEFMQYYTPVGSNHVFKLKAIMHRADYIYQTLICGSSEDLGILALSREARIYKAVKESGVDVRDVSLMPFIFNGVISIRKNYEGEPKNVAMAAFGAYSWLKYCIVVDDDVNARDLADVWWALATRSKPSTGMFVVNDALGFGRVDKLGFHRSKVAIDATVPLDRKNEFTRKRIPGEAAADLAAFTMS